MTDRQLSQRLRWLPDIWKKRKFTFLDVWNYLDLTRTDYKLLEANWGHQIWLIPVGRFKYEVDVYFDDRYKSQFKSYDHCDFMDLCDAELDQLIEYIFIEKTAE